MSPAPLELPGTLHVAPDADTLYDDLSHALMSAAYQAVKDRGVFHLALSGGKTPEPFFIRLVTDPRFRSLPWKQAHIWMVDERRVPIEDDRSNWKMIKETLADHVGMRIRNAHPMPVLKDDAATAYEQELRQAFTPATAAVQGPKSKVQGQEGMAGPPSSAPIPESANRQSLPSIPMLDFILLGMGDDGHTASLFPRSAALKESQRWVVVNDGPNTTPPPRLTMTYPLLNAARELAVLVVGEKKTPTLRRVSEQMRSGGPDPENLPITGIRPTDGEFTWFLDAAAAGQ